MQREANGSSERRLLLKKVVKKGRDPIEIVVCTVVTTCLFTYVYFMLSSDWRHERPILMWILGPLLVGALICFPLCIMAFSRLRNRQAEDITEQRSFWENVRLGGIGTNFVTNMAICSLGALAAGTILGDRNYWLYGTNVYSYRDLVSYVDIDPAKDSGQAFMDSGHAYFREKSMVLRQRFSKFRNGDVYCVAPIVNGMFTHEFAQASPGENSMKGFALPPSGTYDWWAVGTNCCDGADNFTCGDVKSPVARSGMRLLSDSQRPFYLLAVQEWSATYGLPVRHPLFFTWVSDPLTTEEKLELESEDVFETSVWIVTLAGFFVSFLLHMFMQGNKIY